ncbi:hypothetical protein [Streptomyces sp. SID3343]|uniref:hypothetical protein n=1 Tax=Streptomyces sp. SID3343 TaxID=2690260 RepID=UPI00136831E1|nr:hypothetical protein [Streptomyces sp. SID3343]MYW05484.1 hypothetical protein [Streptomyces sp. SID3343]
MSASSVRAVGPVVVRTSKVPLDRRTGDLLVLELRGTAPPPRLVTTTTDVACAETAFGPVRHQTARGGRPDVDPG